MEKFVIAERIYKFV